MNLTEKGNLTMQNAQAPMMQKGLVQPPPIAVRASSNLVRTPPSLVRHDRFQSEHHPIWSEHQQMQSEYQQMSEHYSSSRTTMRQMSIEKYHPEQEVQPFLTKT